MSKRKEKRGGSSPIRGRNFKIAQKEEENTRVRSESADAQLQKKLVIYLRELVLLKKGSPRKTGTVDGRRRKRSPARGKESAPRRRRISLL